MALIRPFAGIRYNTDRVGTDISRQVAPPYDVLGQARKDALLAASRQNIAAVDLPHVPPSQAGPDQVYRQAGELLQQWLADGVLVHDQQPALYRYDQVFEHEARRYTRQKFFAALKLAEFGRGDVLPHEQTFGGPKEDRLKLMQATRCNLSPVFALYSDPDRALANALEDGGRQPDAVAELDGVENRLWRVTDQQAVRVVQELLSDKTIYIADGHHRYGTSLMYRDWLAGQQGELGDDHPANYVLVVLCAMEDEGLLILPTHRVVEHLPSFDLDRLVRDAEGVFSVTDRSTDDARELADRLEALPSGSVVLIHPGSGRSAILALERQDVLDDMAPERSQAWRRFGVSILHRFVIDKLIAAQTAGTVSVRYTSQVRQAVELAAAGEGLALLVQPTRMDQLRQICQAGDLMPQKSTFFYPKLATGLVINPLH